MRRGFVPPVRKPLGEERDAALRAPIYGPQKGHAADAAVGLYEELENDEAVGVGNAEPLWNLEGLAWEFDWSSDVAADAKDLTRHRRHCRSSRQGE